MLQAIQSGATPDRPDVSVRSQSALGPTRLLAALLARAATWTAVAALVLISSMLLMHWGIPYASPTGNLLLKVHPATYLATVAVVLLALAYRPGGLFGTLWRDNPGLLVFLGAIVVLTFQAVVVQHKPVSTLIDTFFCTAMIFIALSRLGPGDRGRLALALHLFFLVNSGLGYVEQLTRFRLTPVILGGELATFEWRSTAFLGHPLVNAAQTGIYLILVSGPAGRWIDDRIRAVLILFHLGALACFGGRTAVVLVLAILSLRGLAAVGAIVAGGRFSRRGAMLMTGLATSLVLAMVALVEVGAFDRFISRFQDDSGSAHTRLAMLHVFDRLTTEAIILGPDPVDIAAAQRRLDITTAIESFVVAFFAYYGVLVTLLFFAGLAAYLLELARIVGSAAVVPILFFLVISASANGISTKTLDLAILTTTVMLIGGFRRDRPAEAARAAAAPPGRLQPA